MAEAEKFATTAPIIQVRNHLEKAWKCVMLAANEPIDWMMMRNSDQKPVGWAKYTFEDQVWDSNAKLLLPVRTWVELKNTAAATALPFFLITQWRGTLTFVKYPYVTGMLYPIGWDKEPIILFDRIYGSNEWKLVNGFDFVRD